MAAPCRDMLTFIAVLLLCLPHGAEGRAPALAHVVLGGQVLAVDLEQGRVVKRLEYIDLLRPAVHAALSAGGQLEIFGDGAAGGWARIRMDRDALKIQDVTPLASDPALHQVSTERVYPMPPRDWNLITSHSGPATHAPRSLRLALRQPGSREQVVELAVDHHAQDCPHEQVECWTVTSDRKQLLVLTSGGYKEQSFLRIYDYPSLRRRATVPLLEMRDDVAFALFAM